MSQPPGPMPCAKPAAVRSAVPDVAEIAEALSLAMSVVGPTRLWGNPDCGLKTRGHAETEPALRNLVEAARQVRAGVA